MVLGRISISVPVARWAHPTAPNTPRPFFGPGWRGPPSHQPPPATPHRTPLLFLPRSVMMGLGGGSMPTQGFGCNPSPSCRPSSIPNAYGHTTGNTPEPVRFQKLSLVRPS